MPNELGGEKERPVTALSFLVVQGKHVVFGAVTKGLDVVKAIEAVGSRNGKTSQPVVVEDCGQLS
jgi:cyclophilin family peptidyl-prolyl cis-trans isomerase